MVCVYLYYLPYTTRDTIDAPWDMMQRRKYSSLLNKAGNVTMFKAGVPNSGRLATQDKTFSRLPKEYEADGPTC